MIDDKHAKNPAFKLPVDLPSVKPEDYDAAIDSAAGSAKQSTTSYQPNHERKNTMSITGKTKEVAGFIKEEIYEHGDSPESKKKAQEGRDLRNEGRIENGKAPKTTIPGTGQKEE